ncbi:MAG: glycosyltransferase [Phycisphaerales bacterium]|nr:glycosyltransferase [Phycisphaerales bacterium]
MPTVSIIMTLFNREAFVESALRSVLTQTFGDLEVVVVDDGSTDASREVVRQVASSDIRVRLFCEPHRGCVGALRRAHELTRGEFVGWVDSDDLLVSSAVERCLGVLRARPEIGLVYTDHVKIDQHGRIIPEPVRVARPFTPDLLLTELVSFHFRLFRREVYERCGGIGADLATSPDYDFCLRASEVAKFAHVPEALYCYRVHPGSISASRRIDQIESSARAVRDALARRGLDAEHELRVTLISRFEIIPKRPDPPR